MANTSSPMTPPFAEASPAELLYPDLLQELAITRKVLERVPDGHTDWTPHTKSTSLGRLATHLAELPRLAMTVLSTNELDWAKDPYVPLTLASTTEILASFDKYSTEMQTALSNVTWEILAQEWVMRAGDQIFVKERKDKLIRTLGLSHMAHHRAQLGVYLRLLDLPVPGVYGPSADEM